MNNAQQPSNSLWRMDNLAYGAVLVMAASMPLSRAVFNLAAAVLVLAWALDDKWAHKWRSLQTDVLMWGPLIFMAAGVFAATYSSAATDVAWGQAAIYGKLLLIPLIASTLNNAERAQKAWGALLLGLAVVLAAVIADIWLEIPGTRTYKNPGSLNRGVFTHHIVQGMHLALLSIFAAYAANQSKNKSIKALWWGTAVLAACAALLVNGSRAGHLALLAGWGTLVFFSLRGLHRVIGLAVLCMATVLAYQSSEFFKSRIDTAVSDLTQYRQDQEKTSGGARLAAWEISAELWQAHKWTGVGLGAYKQEATPKFKDPSICDLGVCEQPHNQWMLTLAEQGVVGALALLVLCVSVFFAPEGRSPYVIATWASLWTVSLFDSSLLIRHQAFTYMMGLTVLLLALRYQRNKTI